MTKRLYALIASIALVVALAACGAPAGERQSIASTAAELGDFDTLLFALGEAGLDGLFADDEAGPFTVFAPTDDAFAALPDGVLADIVDDADLLASVLTYHVIAGAQTPVALVNGGAVATLQGLPLCFAVDGSSFSVNGDTVAAGPIQATNGTIYAVSAVLDPRDSIAGQAIENGFDTLVAAVVAADLVDALVCGGPFTVFAPTDDAFADLLAELGLTAGELLANTELLTQVLLYHVVAGELDEAAVAAALEAGNGTVTLETLQGSSITVTLGEGGIFIDGDSRVVGTDVFARNGVVHVIDAVLVPGE
ncbi:MAG: fasciclin domain-containing protein [Trueperaceae bacterium]|nr:MAG: fasciclin domain-containing protein [Trueperaceae bacterium]